MTNFIKFDYFCMHHLKTETSAISYRFYKLLKWWLLLGAGRGAGALVGTARRRHCVTRMSES